MDENRARILHWLDENPTMARTLSAANKLDAVVPALTPVRFAIIRNITLEPGLPASIKVNAARAGLNASIELGNFDDVQREVYADDSFLYTSRPDVIVVALHLQSLAPRIVQQYAALTRADVDNLAESTLLRTLSLVRSIRERSNALILVHNFALPVGATFGILESNLEHAQISTIRSLNTSLAERLREIRSTFTVDIDYLLSRLGYEASIDDRYWHIGRAPFTFAFGERLSQEYVKFAAALKGRNKKCLVLDCDNTLWGGVVGEEGINGIALGETNPGSAFLEFQAAILSLYHRGVLLAINSKNNRDDVMEVFEKHPAMVLKPEHFVVMKINWEDKASNLRAIALELNIGIDSLVFVDDNPFECQFVRESLPDVAVIELPPDASGYARLLRSCGYFDTLTLSDEDLRRSDMYRSEARRSELKSTTGSMDQYLISLEMVLTIAHATPFSLPRIAQLTQKTNQFNLTTRRYSEGEVNAMVLDPAFRVYSVDLEDKFDRAGIIAAALVHDIGDVSHIDTFLLSCRAIGRGVEKCLLAQIIAESRERGLEMLVGTYLPTSKNGMVKDFFENCGFVRQETPEGEVWTFNLKTQLFEMPTWFKTVLVSEPDCELAQR